MKIPAKISACPLGTNDCNECGYYEAGNDECTYKPQAFFAKTGLILDEDMNFKKWEALGKRLKDIAKSIHFWLGDWMLEGEKKFGEISSQGIDENGFDQKILRNDLSICSRIEKPMRRDDLTWSHHKQVAFFEPKLQEFFLSIAENEILSNDELRGVIKKFKLIKKFKEGKK